MMHALVVVEKNTRPATVSSCKLRDTKILTFIKQKRSNLAILFVIKMHAVSQSFRFALMYISKLYRLLVLTLLVISNTYVKAQNNVFDLGEYGFKGTITCTDNYNSPGVEIDSAFGGMTEYKISFTDDAKFTITLLQKPMTTATVMAQVKKAAAAKPRWIYNLQIFVGYCTKRQAIHDYKRGLQRRRNVQGDVCYRENLKD
jgi:hypothetical protein